MSYLYFFNISNFFDNSFNGLCGSMGGFQVNTSQAWALIKSLLTTFGKITTTAVTMEISFDQGFNDIGDDIATK